MSDLISRSALLQEFETENVAHNSDLWHITGIKAFIENQPTAYNVDKVIHKTKCYFIDKLDGADRSDYCKLVNESHTICDIIRNGGKE